MRFTTELILEILSGSRQGARAGLGETPCSVGSTPDCDLIIASPEAMADDEAAHRCHWLAVSDGAVAVWTAPVAAPFPHPIPGEKPASLAIPAHAQWIALEVEFEIAGVRMILREPGDVCADSMPCPDARDTSADSAIAAMLSSAGSEPRSAGLPPQAAPPGMSHDRPPRARPACRWPRRLATAALAICLYIGTAFLETMFSMQAREAAPTPAPLSQPQPLDDGRMAGARHWLERVGMDADAHAILRGGAVHVVAHIRDEDEAQRVRAELTRVKSPFALEIITQGALLKRVRDVLAESHPTVEAALAGRGRIRLSGLAGMDITQLVAQLHARLPEVAGFEFRRATPEQRVEALRQLAREAPAGAGGALALGPQALLSRPVSLAPMSATRPIPELAKRLSMSAVQQGLLIEARFGVARETINGPKPKMIVMSNPPYVVLSDGRRVYEGNRINENVVSRIEPGALHYENDMNFIS